MTHASAQMLITTYNFNDGGASGATITTPIASTGGSQSTSITTNFTAANVVDFAGTTVNAVAGDAAGNALTFQGGTGAATGGTGGNNGDYFEFTLSTTAQASLALSFAAQRTATGFATITLAYSTTGDTGPFVTFGTAGAGGTAIAASFAATGALSFSLPTAAENQAALTIRATLAGATAATGNVRIDNVQFNSGVVASVPEPSTYATMALGSLGALAMLRSRRRMV